MSFDSYQHYPINERYFEKLSKFISLLLMLDFLGNIIADLSQVLISRHTYIYN